MCWRFVNSFERLLGSWYLITVTANPDKVDEAIKACQVTAETFIDILCCAVFRQCRPYAFLNCVKYTPRLLGQNLED